MTKKIAMKWVKALRSGKYKQAKHRLKSAEGYCCLGVLCEINNIIYTENFDSVLSYRDMRKLTMRSDIGNIPGDVDRKEDSLAELNDSGEYNFDEIADIIQIIYPEL